MTDPIDAKALADTHARIQRRFEALSAQLIRIEKLQEIRDQIARTVELSGYFTASHRTSSWHGSGWPVQVLIRSSLHSAP